MKEKIHPEYKDSTVTCACGATFQTRSIKEKIAVSICSKCQNSGREPDDQWHSQFSLLCYGADN